MHQNDRPTVIAISH